MKHLSNKMILILINNKLMIIILKILFINIDKK